MYVQPAKLLHGGLSLVFKEAVAQISTKIQDGVLGGHNIDGKFMMLCVLRCPCVTRVRCTRLTKLLCVVA